MTCAPDLIFSRTTEDGAFLDRMTWKNTSTTAAATTIRIAWLLILYPAYANRGRSVSDFRHSGEPRLLHASGGVGLSCRCAHQHPFLACHRGDRPARPGCPLCRVEVPRPRR